MSTKEKVEILLCERVAAQINASDGADYVVDKNRHEGRIDTEVDCFLISRSGKFRKRCLQVVTIPFEAALREDRGNLAALKRGLAAKLRQRGLSACRVWLNLKEAGIAHKWKANDLGELASLIATMSVSGTTMLEEPEVWNSSPSLSILLNDVGFSNTGSGSIFVDLSIGAFIPTRGEWLKGAIDNKAAKYRGITTANLSLVIGCLGLVGWEHIAAFKEDYSEAALPFDEIWAVWSNGTEILKCGRQDEAHQGLPTELS